MTSRHDDLVAARAELRHRQGAGARSDADSAPHASLRLARLGTAYFTRAMTRLTNQGFYEASLLDGWNRAALIAHLGYNARALTRLLAWARTGVESPMYASPKQRATEIHLGSSLPPHALRNLFQHSRVHLDVDWRDLPADRWSASVRTAQGREVDVSETPWMRAREVWVHAVDLGTGASFSDFPGELLDRLILDVFASWQHRGETVDLQVETTDTALSLAGGNGTSHVTGTAAAVASWLTGRGSDGLSASPSSLPAIPRWF